LGLSAFVAVASIVPVWALEGWLQEPLLHMFAVQSFDLEDACWDDIPVAVDGGGSGLSGFFVASIVSLRTLELWL